MVASEEGLEHVEVCLSLHRCDRSCEWNTFRTSLDTVLCHSTLSYSADTHQGIKTFVLVHAACWIQIEHSYLTDRCCTDELRAVIDVRTYFKTYTAGHALGKFIRRLTLLLGHPWSRSEVVRTVDGHPSFDTFETVEHE